MDTKTYTNIHRIAHTQIINDIKHRTKNKKQNKTKKQNENEIYIPE